MRKILKDLYWQFRYRWVSNPGLPQNPKKILFVCQGNICRSPFAERASQKLAQAYGLPQLEFASVGLDVNQSLPPPEEAVRTAGHFGIKLDSHRSRPLSPDLMASSDMVLTMDLRHFQALRTRYPQWKGRIFLLSLFEERENSLSNIVDPYGKSREQYRACFEKIVDCLDGLFRRLKTPEGMVSRKESHANLWVAHHESRS